MPCSRRNHDYPGHPGFSIRASVVIICRVGLSRLADSIHLLASRQSCVCNVETKHDALGPIQQYQPKVNLSAGRGAWMSMQPQTSHQGSSLLHNFSDYFNRIIHPRSVAHSSHNMPMVLCCLSGEEYAKSEVRRRQWGIFDHAVVGLGGAHT
jgi:hypothetical protein